MPKSMTRRTFVTTCSLLAVTPLVGVRAATKSGTVNIRDYNNRDWIAAFKQAFTRASRAGLISGPLP
jgi:colanic acid biosynthesis protein WcaM